MKKLLAGVIAALVLTGTLTACGGSHTCNICEKKCGGGHTYRDGAVVFCNSCFNKCFNGKTKVDPDLFFGIEAED